MVNEMMSDYSLDESLEEERADRSTDEDDDELVGQHDPDSDGPVGPQQSVPPRARVPVDWVEFEGALENNSPDLNSFLNLITGDVIRVFENGNDSELTLDEAESSDDFLLIDPISSREQYRWMEEFIEIIDDATLKDKLNIAIDGKGAFRRFKDVLMAYPNERERWFAKRSAKLHTHMAQWLKEKNIAYSNTPPWEGGGAESRRSEDRRYKADGESRSWREGATDLRATAHGLLDIIPSRELPTAVAFLEFLKSRRGHRRTSHS